MSATAQTARRVLITGKRSLALLVVALAGCGGSSSADDSPVDVVAGLIQGFGTTQAIRCEDAGEAEVRGAQVVRCSFEEEEDVSGVMKARDRCYVIENGEAVDVSRELPVGTTCTVSAP